MPFGASGLISIRSYPSRTNSPTDVGSAYVEVMTNRFLLAANMFGAHAIWLTFASDEILRMIAPSNECPPFWSYDPAINNLPITSFLVIKTNKSLIFWNPGYYLERDQNNIPVFNGGKPKLVAHIAPLDKGFMEAELDLSDAYWNSDLGIPKYSEMVYWRPIIDKTSSNGVRFQMLSKLTVNCTNVQFDEVSNSLFFASWTNAIALVVDFRQKVVDGKVLNYTTRKKSISPDEASLLRSKAFVDKLLTSGAVRNSKLTPKRTPIAFVRTIIIIVFALPLLVLILIKCQKRSKTP